MLSFAEFIEEAHLYNKLGLNLSIPANDEVGAIPRGKSIIPNTGLQRGSTAQSTVGVHPTIKRWHKDFVQKSPPGTGEKVTSTQAYESYCEHSDMMQGKDPVGFSRFTDEWKKHSGHMTEKMNGRIYHMGIHLKSDDPP